MMLQIEPLAVKGEITLGKIGGQQPGDPPGGTFELARRIGKSRKTVQRMKNRGLDVWEADRAAVAMGFHPAEVWGWSTWMATLEDGMEPEVVDAPEVVEAAALPAPILLGSGMRLLAVDGRLALDLAS